MHIVGCGMSPAPQRWLFSSVSSGTGKVTLLRRGWSLGIGSPPLPDPLQQNSGWEQLCRMEGTEPFLTRGCRDASQHALVAAGKMLGSEEFRCAGVEGDFWEGKARQALQRRSHCPGDRCGIMNFGMQGTRVHLAATRRRVTGTVSMGLKSTSQRKTPS